MKNLTYFFLLSIAIIGFMSPAFALAEDSEARQIMQRVEDRDRGDNRIADMEMTLVDKYRNARVRKIKVFSKEKGDDRYQIMFFFYPPDVEGTSFLTYDYDSEKKDDDQWLYLPALKRSKRIASSDKSGSFMGSDLNYSDMTSRNLDDFEFKIIKEASVRDHEVWLIEALPRSKKVVEETGYSKYLLFVRKDIYFVVRSIGWVEGSDYLKYMDVRNLEKIEGIWVGTEILVHKKRGKEIHHETILRLSNVKFNQDLTYELFTTRQMERGL